MPLEVSVTEKDPGIFAVSPVGYIDTNTYKALDKEVSSVLSKSPRAIIFDMGAVAYISSIGMGIILRTKKLLKANKGKLFMVNLQPKVKKVFEVIYTGSYEEIFPSMEELDAHLEKTL